MDRDAILMRRAGPGSFADRWRPDLVAGITNGILSVPQGIAFALIAGVPPIHGLYAMVVPTIAAALLRDSPHLVAGSTNTSALVIGALVAPLSARHQLPALELMLLITLLMGSIQICFALLRLGKSGRYVSQAVLVGFTLGAATLIAVGQLKNVLGLDLKSQTSIVGEIQALAAHAGGIDPRALLVALLCLACLYGSARLSPLLPGPLIALAASAALVAGLNWGQGPASLPVLSEIPRELPSLAIPGWPGWAVLQELLIPSLAIGLLGMVETISIGKALASRSHLPFKADRELAANGVSNVLGAFTGCLPASASWTRSAINIQLGAQSRWAGVIAGGTVLAIMLLLSPWARYVPKASLGALIIWIAIRMVDPKTTRYVWRWSRADAAVLLITLGAMLCLPVEYAIYLGVFASLLLLVRRAGRLHMVELVETGPGHFREWEIDEATGRHPITVLQVEGDLFFGVVEELERRLNQISANGTRAIILRMKRALAIDATAAETLATFAAHFQGNGSHLILCGLKKDLHRQIRDAHLGELVGSENLLTTGSRAFESVQQAVGEARRRLAPQGGPTDPEAWIRNTPPGPAEAWIYHI